MAGVGGGGFTEEKGPGWGEERRWALLKITDVLHLLLFISAKRTFICAKRCINNLYCTFLNTASNIIGAKRLSIAIFKYARAFNSINRQSTKRRDNHLGGTLFHVRAMKIQ